MAHSLLHLHCGPSSEGLAPHRSEKEGLNFPSIMRPWQDKQTAYGCPVQHLVHDWAKVEVQQLDMSLEALRELPFGLFSAAERLMPRLGDLTLLENEAAIVVLDGQMVYGVNAQRALRYFSLVKRSWRSGSVRMFHIKTKPSGLSSRP